MTAMVDWFGHLVGMPLILAGYLLSFLAEGLVRAGAWLAGRQVVGDESNDG